QHRQPAQRGRAADRIRRFTKETIMIKQILSAVAVLGLACMATAQEWGDLEGTFLFKGTAPTPDKIAATKDPEFCGKHMLVDEKLVVNKDNKGLANVVVYLADAAKPKIHPDYDKDAKAEVILDNE